MQERLQQVQAEFTTSLEGDEALLGSNQQLSDWNQVALEYRIERKKLAKAMDSILRLYARLAEEGR